MITRIHMSANIEGMLRYFARKKMTGILTDDNGKPLSDSEARAELKRLKALGHKLIPSGDCEGFDPFGGGCPGHPILEEGRLRCFDPRSIQGGAAGVGGVTATAMCSADKIAQNLIRSRN